MIEGFDEIAPLIINNGPIDQLVKKNRNRKKKRKKNTGSRWRAVFCIIM